MTECLNLFGKLLMVLLRKLGRLLELLVLGLVLLEHVKKLLLFLHLDLGLLLVGLDLLLEFRRLRVNLRRQGVFNATLLAVLLAQLRRHELHLFGALFLELLILDLQVRRLLLNQLVLFLRLRHVLRHLRAYSAEVVVEVFENFLSLGLLIVLNRDVALLELRVLSVVLASDLLVLLPNDVGLGTTVLVFKCLLVV